LVDLLPVAYLISTPITMCVRCRPRRSTRRRRIDAAEDRTVPGTMMARPGVDGQVVTVRSPGVFGGRKPYNSARTIEPYPRAGERAGAGPLAAHHRLRLMPRPRVATARKN